MCKLHNCHPDNLCYWCRNKAKPKTVLKRTPLKPSQKKIKPRSDKRAIDERKYGIRVKVWKVENPECKARLEGCRGITEHCHHKKGKEGKLLLIEKHWLPVCGNCHDKIGVLSIETAIEQGLSTRRNISITERIK